MRKIMILLLTLSLLCALGLTALAEAPNGEITIDIPGQTDGIAIDGVALEDGLEALVSGGADMPLSNDLALSGSDLPEVIEDNASVPAKLTLGVGESYALKVSDAKKYQSSNTKVATVSSKGVVKGKKTGSATITVTLKKGGPLKVKVTVKKAPASVKLNKTKLTLQAGKTCQLKATLSSKSASKLTWTSSKKSVATVDASGLVTAVKAGTAVITVKTFNKKEASCTVTVKPASHKVGVAMPTADLFRWSRDGQYMQEQLSSAGYSVDLQFASNDVATQLNQIENMIDEGCQVLVIAPIEASSLCSVLDKAAEKGVKVIAYDRLLRDSDKVSYYVTFDNYQVGVIQADYIKKALKLDSAKGPFNIEFTAGDPGDWNAELFYQGAMDVLKPYIKSGKLKVRSGQTTFSKVATDYWSPDNARKRAEKILSANYPDGTRLHAWLCSNDSTAQGVIKALEAKYAGKWPIVTGQDCDINNVKYIIEGKQAMSVFKDTKILVDQTVKMVGQILNGKKVSVNDTKTYDNGAKVVPAFLCKPSYVDKGNYREKLIDSGIYPEDLFS